LHEARGKSWSEVGGRSERGEGAYYGHAI
jgi:hypothetical protein